MSKSVVQFKFRGYQQAREFQLEAFAVDQRGIRSFLVINNAHPFTHVYIPKKQWKPEVPPSGGPCRAA